MQYNQYNNSAGSQLNNLMRIACRSVTAKRTFYVLAACMFSASTIAEDNDWLGESWDFNGFGTIGYTQSKKYPDRIPRRNIQQSGAKIQDNGFLMDSRLGFQVKGQLSDHWEVVGQFVVREQLANRFEDHLDIAFARYRSNHQWEIALGRHSFDLFFLSDHTNAGYSYDWVRPPTELYGFIPFDSFDGVKVSTQWGEFDNAWRWNVSIGKVKSKFDLEVEVQGNDVDSTRGKPIYATQLTWQSGPWQLRGSIAKFTFEQEVEDRDEVALLVDELTPVWPDIGRIIRDFSNSFKISYSSVGASWQQDNWKVQGELSIIDSDFVSFGGHRGYVSISKRFDDWQPFFAIGYARDDQSVNYGQPIPGFGLEPIYDEVINAIENFRHNQRSYSLGVRWDVARQKALKLQCDQFKFDANSGSIHGRVDYKYLKNETKAWCSVAFDWVF